MELKHVARREGRLSSFLREELAMSAGLMNRLKWQGKIFVNGAPQHTDYPVKPGDVITVPLDEPQPEYPAEDGDLTVLYEDDWLLAVDKPAGMLIHPSRSRLTGTLANLVLGYYRQTGQDCAFHPLTRLDRDTFGVVLLAKNAHVHTLLQNCQVRKTYHALVLGSPPESSGVIDAPIARKPLPSLLREIRPDGKPSVTEYTVLRRFPGCTLLALRPITGRTHQLRLHCAHMGFPILGDPQYGTQDSRMDGLSSQLLCAKELALSHPVTGEPLRITSRMEASVLAAYPWPDAVTELCLYGQGHINTTYRLSCGDTRFILQRISPAFRDPQGLMENIAGVTDFLKKKLAHRGQDPHRGTLTVVPTKTSQLFHTDCQGNAWRVFRFIENTVCHQESDPARFESAGRAFGDFQYLLQDYPARTLHETLPRFHDTEDRLRLFQEALAADIRGRAAQAREEIAFVLARQADCSVAMEALRAGKLPLRVTHNDTKLNNVLMDAATGQALCVIDLDTVMPGLSIHDFGDAIRFGANHAAEDEPDLNKVNFDLSLYEAFTRGFLAGTRGCLTEQEMRYLPWGARLMTLECGIRFLTDFLQGDTYFHIQDETQNLRRCRTQFKLVADMEAQFSAMEAIIERSVP